MKRSITGYRTDEQGDLVALLDCGHPQHVRHQPPFVSRPWTQSEAGRAAMLGQTLDCVRCDRFELPEGFVAYKRTPEFSETTLPAALRDNHTTKRGVWAKIVVLAGRLRYSVDSLHHDETLTAAQPGTVIAEVPHRVEPLGPVRFFVEFYRAPDT